jgi:demethylmenaquinone methyltransferase/2-methoxy-6-polyprenyl-1,4-benzoquinol methylase
MVRNNQSVLELACGTGVLSSMLASSGKNVIGIDLVLEYLLSSRHKLDLPVTQGTAEVLPFRNESFDAVVSSYLPKYVDSRILAQECWRILKPGGVAVFHDFTYPRLRWMRILWNAYFAILRFCGLFLPAWRPVFQQLDGVIRRSRWDEQLFESLRSEGFANIICESHTAGSSAIVRADKP